jgi:sugar lactone lactonase YvrE
MVIGVDGSVYVADTGNSRIVKYSSTGELMTTWGNRTLDGQIPQAAGTFIEPWGIALDADGNILVADTWNHRIQKFDSEGNFLLQWGVSGLAGDGLDRLWGPRGIAISPDGKVYVTDTGNKRVVVFTSDGKALFEFDSSEDARLDEPVGIALGPEGKVYVSDTWNMRVAVFSQDGKYLSSFPIQGWNSDSMDNKPYLAVDHGGNIYVTDPEGYRVLIFSNDGKPLLVFGQYGIVEGDLGLPNGIALGPDNSLWIADTGNNRLANYRVGLP